MLAKSIITVMSLAIAAPAFAASGTDQLAAQLGVAPGVYTLAQLTQLQSARNDNDQQRFDFILSQAGVEATRNAVASGAVNPGVAQIAAQVGVSPNAYSLNDLIGLQNAIQANDSQTVAFILGGSENGAVNSDRGTVSPGKAMLANRLGVSAADYTTAELATMYNAAFN